jgi:hypothetical protein
MPQGRGKSNSSNKPKNKEPNLVVVTVTDTPSGRNLDIGTSGNIKLTEAPTLLRLAANIAEDNLGLTR